MSGTGRRDAARRLAGWCLGLGLLFVGPFLLVRLVGERPVEQALIGSYIGILLCCAMAADALFEVVIGERAGAPGLMRVGRLLFASVGGVGIGIGLAIAFATLWKDV